MNTYQLNTLVLKIS